MDVTVKMLRADLVEGSFVSALEHRPEGFDPVGVGHPVNILADAVLHSFMLERHSLISTVIVGVNRRAFGCMITDETLQCLGICFVNNTGCHHVATVFHTNRRRSCRLAAPGARQLAERKRPFRFALLMFLRTFMPPKLGLNGLVYFPILRVRARFQRSAGSLSCWSNPLRRWPALCGNQTSTAPRWQGRGDKMGREGCGMCPSAQASLNHSELMDVTVKMLRADLVEGSFVSALEHRPEGFDVGVGHRKGAVLHSSCSKGIL